MQLTTTNKKILTIALFSLNTHLKKQHPEAEKEILETAEKIGLLKEYKVIERAYGQFDKMINSLKELGTDEPKHTPEEDQATIDLIKNAMKSQDKPDQN